MPFDYTTGSPDNLTGGGPARMQDIQGPFYDIRAYLNTAIGGGGGTGGSTPVLATAAILDVGVQGQVRAGRQLTVADFTTLGLTQPVGLWNLSDLTNLGSDAQALANKAGVTFGAGINGFAATSAVFNGPAGSALYIVGASAGNYNIRTGSWGCWFRTAKRGLDQIMLGKYGVAPQLGWYFTVLGSTNAVQAAVSVSGSDTFTATGVSDVADDRWHFAVVTCDGTTMRLYVDGALEGSGAAGLVFASNSPFNIGGIRADSGTAPTSPHYGRVDEAFVTNDILTEDQIRCLYAAKLTHTLGVAPTAVRVNVHRRRKGPAFVVTDFTTQPLRLHNFTAGALADEGSNGQTLSNGYTTVIVPVAGADGAPSGAFTFGGVHTGLVQTDAGLPATTATRSYGCWFKTTAQNVGVMGYGSTVTSLLLSISSVISASSGADTMTGPFVSDGQWHFAAVTEDNAAGDGVRRKLYLDGRLVVGSTVLNSLALGGASRFRVGAFPDGTTPFTGQIDAVFVTGYALAQDEILRLYAKGSQDHGASPKNPGDHVERVTASDVLWIADTLESQHTVDLAVVA